MPLYLFPSVATPVEVYQPVAAEPQDTAAPTEAAEPQFIGGIFRPRPPATPVPPIGQLPPITPVPPIGQIPPIITPVPPIGDIRPACPCWAMLVPELLPFCDPTRPCTWPGSNLPPGPPLRPPVTPVPPIGEIRPPCPWCTPCTNCGTPPITPVPPIGNIRCPNCSSCSNCSNCQRSRRRTNCCCSS